MRHLNRFEIISHPSRAVFFNLFVAAEPYASVKVTHGTPYALIRESSEVCEDETTKGLRNFKQKTSMLSISTTLSGVITGHLRNPWLSLVEPLGSAEPRLKITGLGVAFRDVQIFVVGDTQGLSPSFGGRC